jgi:hypothetical protein
MSSERSDIQIVIDKYASAMAETTGLDRNECEQRLRDIYEDTEDELLSELGDKIPADRDRILQQIYVTHVKKYRTEELTPQKYREYSEDEFVSVERIEEKFCSRQNACQIMKAEYNVTSCIAILQPTSRNQGSCRSTYPDNYLKKVFLH